MSAKQQTWFHLFEMIVLGGGIGWAIARVLDPDPQCPGCPVCGGDTGGDGGGGGGGGATLPSGAPSVIDSNGSAVDFSTVYGGTSPYASDSGDGSTFMSGDSPASVTHGFAPSPSSSSAYTSAPLGALKPLPSSGGSGSSMPSSDSGPSPVYGMPPAASPSGPSGPSPLPKAASAYAVSPRPAAPPPNAPGAQILRMPVGASRMAVRRK